MFAVPITETGPMKVVSARGDIKVTPSADNQAHVFIHKTLRGESQNDADLLNLSTHPKFQQQRGIWILDLTGGDCPRGPFHLDLHCPCTAPLSHATPYVDTSLPGSAANAGATT